MEDSLVNTIHELEAETKAKDAEIARLRRLEEDLRTQIAGLHVALGLLRSRDSEAGL